MLSKIRLIRMILLEIIRFIRIRHYINQALYNTFTLDLNVFISWMIVKVIPGMREGIGNSQTQSDVADAPNFQGRKWFRDGWQ